MKFIFLISLLFLFCIAKWTSCLHKSKFIASTIRVKNIFNIDSNTNLYWFNDASLLTSEGYNYFQIAKDICDLSFDKANAMCFSPIAILKTTNDSIFIVAQDSIQTKVEIPPYKFVRAEYDIKLIDSYKIPNYKEAFIVRDTCKTFNKRITEKKVSVLQAWQRLRQTKRELRESICSYEESQ